jgi:hypothetical protein
MPLLLQAISFYRQYNKSADHGLPRHATFSSLLPFPAPYVPTRYSAPYSQTPFINVNRHDFNRCLLFNKEQFYSSSEARKFICLLFQASVQC